MRTGCILFACGVACILFCSELPPAYLVWLFLPGIFLALRFPILKWPLCFVCGVLWTIFRADIILQNRLDAELEGKHLILEGRVVSLPAIMESAQGFIVDVNKLTDRQGKQYAHPDKVRLSWYKAGSRLVPGEHWRFNVKLKRPNGFMNPGGFDYEAWLFQQGIQATGYVSNKPGNTLLRTGSPYYLHRLRYQMREKLHASLTDKRSGTLIPALIIGDRSAIQAQHWRVLTMTGTSHLLAISGLHIGLIAGIVYFLVRWLWPLGRISALYIPAPKAAALAAILAALGYAAMAGFSVPTQRALIMLSLVMAFNLASLKLPPSRIISLALLLVLVIDPFTLLSAAFWLSFSAILIITYGMTARVNSRGLWWRWGRVQYLVAVGLTPLLTFWFHQVPLSSICANLIVVPWVSFITVPLVLLGSLMLWLNIQFGSWLLDLAMKSIDLFWPLLEILSQFEFSVFYLAEPGPAALIAAVIGVLLILMPTGLPGRWIGLVWLLPLLLPVADKAETGEARLSLLDVGQGLAAVVETRNHLLLFDTGPRYSDNFDAGSAVIKPFLQRKNIRHVDMLVQSHGDNDHIGGLANILATVSVERILSSVPEQIEHSKVNDCRNGQVWEWDGVSFEILHPAGNTDLSGNNRSCVLKVSAGESAILLTGDIEAKAEYRILARDREKLAATILVAPHHGSLSSSTEKFIAAVQPEFVLFPVGYRNRFGFPKQDIIRRYQERGIVSMDSARDGAIEMRIGTGDFTIRRYRQNARRFWHRTN